MITISPAAAASAAVAAARPPFAASASAAARHDIEAGDLVPGLDEIGRHRRAHIAEPDKADRRHLRASSSAVHYSSARRIRANAARDRRSARNKRRPCRRRPRRASPAASAASGPCRSASRARLRRNRARPSHAGSAGIRGRARLRDRNPARWSAGAGDLEAGRRFGQQPARVSAAQSACAPPRCRLGGERVEDRLDAVAGKASVDRRPQCRERRRAGIRREVGRAAHRSSRARPLLASSSAERLRPARRPGRACTK